MRAESPTGPLGKHVASTAISTDCMDESNFDGNGLPNLGTQCARDQFHIFGMDNTKG